MVFPALRSTLLLVTWFLVSPLVHGDSHATADPLFQSHDILSIRIAAPLTTLLKERPFDQDLAASLQYKNSDDVVADLEIGIRTRGRFRRQPDICRFPPMRLNFKTSAVKDSLFRKQDKLKLVTHCDPARQYTQNLMREYLAYRILNALTDVSYKVRLLEITYVDTDGRRGDEVRYGFLIEHKDRLAKRLDRSPIDVERTVIRNLDAEYTNLTSVYQYLIGNTDFSPIRAAPGETCCHNHVLFGNDSDAIYSIPYDFDQSGIVNAAYAAPSSNFRLRSVRQRLYRGRCVNNGHLDATIALFQARRQAIRDVVSEPAPLTARSRKAVLKYIDQFYATLESEQKVEKSLFKKCI